MDLGRVSGTPLPPPPPADFAGTNDIIINLTKEREPGNEERTPLSLIITHIKKNVAASNFTNFEIVVVARGLTLETSALGSLYHQMAKLPYQAVLSSLWINQTFDPTPHRRSTTISLEAELAPLFILSTTKFTPTE